MCGAQIAWIAGRGQLERELCRLHDHVVVAERVPLLELHRAAVYVYRRARNGQRGCKPGPERRPSLAALAAGRGRARVAGGAGGVDRRAVPGAVPLADRPHPDLRRGLLRQRRARDRRDPAGGRPSVRERAARRRRATPSIRSWPRCIIAAGIELFGDGPVAWRLPSVLLGTVAMLGLFALVRAAGGGRWTALGATALMAADNLLLVHGRIATLDIYATAAMIWGAAAVPAPPADPGRGRHRHRRVRQGSDAVRAVRAGRARAAAVAASTGRRRRGSRAGWPRAWWRPRRRSSGCSPCSTG